MTAAREHFLVELYLSQVWKLALYGKSMNRGTDGVHILVKKQYLHAKNCFTVSVVSFSGRIYFPSITPPLLMHYTLIT
jgi:hypothetical protein